MKLKSKIALSFSFAAVSLMGLNTGYALDGFEPADVIAGEVIGGTRPPAQGYPLTVCAQGRLTKVERTWGADGGVRIASESSPAPYDSYRTVPGLGNMTELGFGPTATERDKDRLSLLQLAMAHKLPVQVVTSGQSCVGASDAFDITLCTEGAACAQPR